MTSRDDPLSIDAAGACERIEHLIRSTLERLGRAGALVGLSGGLDSAVAAALCVRALGAGRTNLFYLPERDSGRRHGEDAELLARGFGVPLQREDIAPVLEALGIYDLLPLQGLPGRRVRGWAVRLWKKAHELTSDRDWLLERFRAAPGSMTAKANAFLSAKHRVRMVTLYRIAEEKGLAVVGAANRTELLTGTFSMWGCDHSADVMPLLHLYRTQVEQVAEFLALPERIRGKAADPDVLPGIDDKGRLLGSFRETDLILQALESGAPRERIEERHGAEAVRGVVTLMERSRHLREAPYTVDINKSGGDA